MSEVRCSSQEEWPTFVSWLKFFKRGRSIHFSYSARLDVQVSAQQDLHVDNSYGDIMIRGVSGKIVIRNQSGGVDVEGGGGSLDVRTSYAPTSIVDFKGPVEIELFSLGGSPTKHKDIRPLIKALLR